MILRIPKGVDVVVVVHLYYLDMLENLAVKLDKLRELMDFDVAVSIPYEHEPHIEMIAERLNAFIVEPMENRGRDVLPFLRMLKHVHEFKYGLKIHTKRIDDPWDGPFIDGLPWRDTLWNHLLEPHRAKDALEALRCDSRIYAPTEVWFKRFSFSKKKTEEAFESNFENMKKLSEILDIDIKESDFIAGTMFWFEINHLTWLSEYFDVLEPLFEEESGARDGKIEHAFERSFHIFAYYHLHRERLD